MSESTYFWYLTSRSIHTPLGSLLTFDLGFFRFFSILLFGCPLIIILKLNDKGCQNGVGSKYQIGTHFGSQNGVGHQIGTPFGCGNQVGTQYLLPTTKLGIPSKGSHLPILFFSM